jgi:hypothetical protein
MKISTKLKTLVAAALTCAGISPLIAATSNTGNPPAFIMVDLCSNGIGDAAGGFDIPRLEPDVFDIGIDVDADGTVDEWLSQQRRTWLGGGNANEVTHAGWKRLYFFQLDAYVGRTMKLVIVDRSAQYYMAINAIRVNGADGRLVPNAIRNGLFEAANPLEGWTVTGGNIANPATLVQDDPQGFHVAYSGKFLCTMTSLNSGNYAEEVVLESDPFVLPPITSFLYANLAGGISEFVNIPGADGSDNASGVYIDLGTETTNPDGRFELGKDLAIEGFWGGSGGVGRRDMEVIVVNTSGLEGRRAQVVGFDNSQVHFIALDAIRLNWDWEEKIIVNGGFDQGGPTPETHPEADAWWREAGLELPYTAHPSGKIPGWTVSIETPGLGNAWFFDPNADNNHRSGFTYVGTGGGALDHSGVEIRSDVFVIEPIPAADRSVFVQFASGQATDKLRYSDDGSQVAVGRVQLIVDVNGNGEFGDEGDFTYTQRNQGMAPNNSNSGRDLWQHPEYRWYIRPEHQGLRAIFHVEERFGAFKSAWGWLAVDDLFVWDGKEARLAFENSDFEKGTMENWIEDLGDDARFTTWLAGDQFAMENELATHRAMNNRSTDADGRFSADSGPNETGAGDRATGALTSIPFQLPTLAAVVEPTALNVRWSDGKVVLDWSGNGTLESAASISGTWMTVPGASRPHVVEPTAAAAFYRVR